MWPIFVALAKIQHDPVPPHSYAKVQIYNVVQDQAICRHTLKNVTNYRYILWKLFYAVNIFLTFFFHTYLTSSGKSLIFTMALFVTDNSSVGHFVAFKRCKKICQLILTPQLTYETVIQPT